jgi:probable rRNA maturation factor
MITVTVINAHPIRRVPVGRTSRLVRSVLRGERIGGAMVTVVLVDSRRIRRINRRYLAHDFVTDVISFPLEARPRLEGEVYVNLDRARSQAREYGVPVWNEVVRLLVHGTLHLAGYDDRSPGERARMERRQEALVSRLARGQRKRA